MLLRFEFKPRTPTWREFQRELEQISGRKVAMTGGHGPSGGPEVWAAKAGGLKGKLIFEYQVVDDDGLVIYAIEAHRTFVRPLVEVCGGTRRSPRVEARKDGRGLDYSNGPNPYDPQWLEFTSGDQFFRLDMGYFDLLFGGPTLSALQARAEQLVTRIFELEADELVLDSNDLIELRRSLEAVAGVEPPVDSYLAEDVSCCQEDFREWLEAAQRADARVAVTRHR